MFAYDFRFVWIWEKGMLGNSAMLSGVTACNGQQHIDMLPADPPAATFDEAVSCSADEIGNFENGPVHLLVLEQQLVEMGHGNLAVTNTYT